MLKLNKYTLLLLGVYCIPFVFLSMYDDMKNYSMIVYGITLIVLSYLAFLAKRKSSFIVLVAANILSFFSSYLWLTRVVEFEERGYYFSPFTPVQLLLFASVLFGLLQVAVYLFTKRPEYKNSAKHGAVVMKNEGVGESEKK